eukprot:TRINITY_DN49493_c0_g1_i1.p1 TRINITY_DN49493_c0_g1~~TRINITY_DN49493_c0_g1_i1.p1  ORF type:complete len:413 (+),score=132.69 TRINITY_DN49493_c0_g1_i1:103-1341(+)
MCIRDRSTQSTGHLRTPMPLSDPELLFPIMGAAVALCAVAAYFRYAASRRQSQKMAQQLLLDGAKQNKMSLVRKALETSGVAVETRKGPVSKQAIHFAAQYDSLDVLEFLIQSGSDLDAMDPARMTPLHYAAMKGSIAAIKLLLKHGASVEARDSADYTPLLFAALDGHEKAAEILIDAGSDLDARDKVGQTGLMFAACKNKVPVLRLLLERGADRFLLGKGNITALGYALKKKNRVCIDLLEGKEVPVRQPAAERKHVPKKRRGPVSEMSKGPGFDHGKALKPAEVGEVGYREPEVAKQKGGSKLEELVRRHEASAKAEREESSNSLAKKLSEKGFGCVSAFDKEAAAKALEDLQKHPDMCAEMAEQIKTLGLDKLESVSYTHLRAHETPEHLVCRLLLEKKKKKEWTRQN